MPRTPVYNNGAPVPTQAGSERLAAASGGRGVTVDSSAMLGAVRVPLLDPSGVRAQARGIADLGQGVAGVGETITKVAEMGLKAKMRNQVFDAQTGWVEREANIQAALEAQPDPDKWPEITERILKQPMPWMERDLSPLAKDEIAAINKRHETAIRGRVQVQTAGAHMKKDLGNSNARRQFATNNADTDAANQEVEFQRSQGYITDEQAKVEYQVNAEAIEATKKKRRASALEGFKNQTIEIAKVQPLENVRSFIEHGPDAGNTTPEEKQYLKGIAAGVASDETRNLTEQITEGIGNGNVWNEYELDATFGANPHFTATLKKQALRSMALMNNAVAKQRVIENAPALSAQMEVAVRQYDPRRDTQSDGSHPGYWNLMQRIQSLPGNYRESLVSALNRRANPKASAADKTTTESAMDILKSYFDNGDFGVFKTKSEDSTGREVTVIDGEAERRAIQQMGAAKEYVRQWLKDNPEATITDKATQAMFENLQRDYTVRAGAPTPAPINTPLTSDPENEEFLRRYGAPTVPGEQGDIGQHGFQGTGGRVTSFGYPSDETPDSNSAAGIGSFTTEADAKGGRNAPTRLRPNDFAVSPDVEDEFRAAGIKPRDTVTMKLADGSVITGRWMDRTANDAQAARLGLKPLRGRFDLYSPEGVHKRDSTKVIGWKKGVGSDRGETPVSDIWQSLIYDGLDFNEDGASDEDEDATPIPGVERSVLRPEDDIQINPIPSAIPGEDYVTEL